MTRCEILAEEIQVAILRAVMELAIQPAALRVDVGSLLRLPLGYQFRVVVKTPQRLIEEFSVTVRAE